MKSFLFTVLISACLIFILTKCANVGQPTGGPKDIEPPVLLATYPKDQAC